MHRVMPPLSLYVFMTWCLVKHRDNFTFTFRVLAYFKVLSQHLFTLTEVTDEESKMAGS
jgi:hypothetical protein